ncbi:MAG: hypothetical protein HY016_12620 [Nitrosomonadales bacterium]|nr:hypothetical protein [Nitrosomonadales bacterium]
MVSLSILLQHLKARPALLAFIFSAALIATLCFTFDPLWETNDDIAMSMIAHGYGLNSYSSPNLINSNVLWGYLVRAIPSINGVLGYSLAMLIVLLVIGWATLYFLLRLGTGYLLGFLAVFLLLLRPTLLPQFTVNAGLLTVAAIIGWQVYARFGGRGNLAIACLLAFFGYLIRDKEFLLVLGIALPLLPWRALRERRQMQIAFLLLGTAIASAAAFDRWSYSGPEWRYVMEMRPPLTSLIDFRAGKHFEQHPEILARHGYTQNDINLVSDWFFADQRIADPQPLNTMLTELGAFPAQEGGVVALQALFGPVLLPLALSAFLLLLLMPRWRIALTWMLCLLALFVMGAMGRPTIFRVYVPLMGLLLIAPLMLEQTKHAIRRRITAFTLLIACLGSAYLLMPTSLVYKQWAQQFQRNLHGLPAEPIVSWADSFLFVLAFPVLANDPASRNIRFYGLDSLTHTPFSVAHAEQMSGRGILERLRTETGIPIMASQHRLEMLSTYCREHMNGQLLGTVTHQGFRLAIQQVRCAVNE